MNTFPEIEFDDENVVRFVHATWSNDALDLEIQISTPELTSKVWRFHCDELLSYDLRNGDAASLSLSDDHPLLWKFQYDSASAFFCGTPPSVSVAWVSLFQAHNDALGEWVGFETYLNDQVGLYELLSGGHGRLAEGPVPILNAYKNALRPHGIDVDIRSPHPPGGPLAPLAYQEKLRNDSRVLLVGDSYVIGIGWTAV